MNVFQIHPHDNVAVAVDAVAKGSVVTAGGKTFTVCQDIPAGHKIAIKEIKKAELQLQDVTNQLQKKNNHRHRLEEECAGIQLQQTEHIRQEKIRLQGEIERVNQELNMLTALKNQIAHERASVVQALQEKEQQLIKQQQQQFDEQRSQIEQTIGKIRQQQTQVLAELQTESDRAMAEKGVDVATLRREEQKLQKLKKEQKISTRMMKAYETRLFALEIFSKTFIGKIEHKICRSYADFF